MSRWDRGVLRANSGSRGVRSQVQRPLSAVVIGSRLHNHQIHHGNNVGGGGHGQQLHWTSPNGLYCGIDSDEDSGIGHSNNGRVSLNGDRVGSTSSAEADIPLPPPRSIHYRSHPPRCRPTQTNAKLWAPPPIGHPANRPFDCRMLDSSASTTTTTDEVFHSFCAYLGGPTRCGVANSNKPNRWGGVTLSAPSVRRSASCHQDVFSYSGESSRYANIYENMHCGGVCGAPRIRTKSSTSIASLITVDSDLISVRAIPATVISVDDENGEAPANESLYGHSRGGGGGCYESIAAVKSKSNGKSRDPVVVERSSPKDSQMIVTEVGADRRVGEVHYAQVQKPKKSSKMKSSQSSSNGFDRVDVPIVGGGLGANESEPPLPPRNYRRNSVRNVNRTVTGASVGVVGSRSSLAEKVQDFTRSAKQALRRALSLDALHGRPSIIESRPLAKFTTPSIATDPQWDDDDDCVDSEWRARRRPVAVALIHQRSSSDQPQQQQRSPCRLTPSAVKAKSAARVKTSVTLC